MSEHPAEDVQPATEEWRQDGPSGPRASFGRRLVAYLIDAVLLGIVGGVLGALLDRDSVESANGISLLLGLLYFPYFEGGSTGQTLGKKALGIRVIDFNTGGPIGYGRGVVRYLGRILSGIALLIGYLWMLWDREKQTWHDKLATTVVVPEKFYPVS
jgi:uncharacterized RDD family membrane protein YckC